VPFVAYQEIDFLGLGAATQPKAKAMERTQLSFSIKRASLLLLLGAPPLTFACWQLEFQVQS
jgi:hypothetical protein